MSNRWNGMPPGSDAAYEQGCTCPRHDNQYGEGAYEFEGEPQFMMFTSCPLHGGEEETGDER